MQDEGPGWVYPRSPEPTGVEQVPGSSPAMPPAEMPPVQPVRAELEPTSPSPSPEVAPPPEPSHVNQVSERPANPRRGWWQRTFGG